MILHWDNKDRSHYWYLGTHIPVDGMRIEAQLHSHNRTYTLDINLRSEKPYRNERPKQVYFPRCSLETAQAMAALEIEKYLYEYQQELLYKLVSVTEALTLLQQ
jgi:hypothetical protein